MEDQRSIVATSRSLETIAGAVASGAVAEAVAKRLEADAGAIWFLTTLLSSATLQLLLFLGCVHSSECPK